MFKAIFGFLPFVFCAGAVFAFVRPARMGVRAQAVWTMLLTACAAKFVCFEAFGGDAFAPELPEAVIWAWGWAYSGMCILFAVSAAWQILRFATRGHVPQGRGPLWLAGVPAFAWALAAIGVWNGIKAPAVKEIELPFDGLPAALDGYRILQISDLHVSAAATRRRTLAVVAAANAAEADLVCLTGDYVDGMASEQGRNLEPLKDLKAKDGVFAVTGNHEYYFDYPGWTALYHRWGIRFLANECVFPRPGLAVGGVDDIVCGRLGIQPPDPAAAFAAATNGEFRVFLQHRPWADYRLYTGRDDTTPRDLQLSGHTHGGIAPVLSSLIGRFNRGLVRGLYSTGQAKALYVSPGAGQWAGFPVRFFNDPEITVFTLRRR